jgi:hypothetical protein
MKQCAITLCLITFELIACNEKIELKRISIASDASLVKVDSNERLQMSIYRVTKQKALGKMDIFHVIGKDSLFPTIAFKIVDDKNGTRISKDYLAFTKAFGEKNWGWFQIKNGKPSDTLPNLYRIMDSLKACMESNILFLNQLAQSIFLKKVYKLRGSIMEIYNINT